MSAVSDPAYRFPVPIVPATFHARPTRFTAEIEIDGRASTAHINSSGRMQELLVPGRTVGVSAAANTERRSPWDLKLVRAAGGWMSIDSLLANRLVGFWLEHRMLDAFTGYTAIRREARMAGSRFDFVLTGVRRDEIIEVKSVTLNVGRWGVFPDAPTTRGARHVEELAAMSRDGHRCAVIWVMLHPRMEQCWANPLTDPAFTRAVKDAGDAGVRLLAYQARVTRRAVHLLGPRPVQPLNESGMAALRRHVDRHANQPLAYTAAERRTRPKR